MRNFGGISTLDAKPAPGGEDDQRKPPRSGSSDGQKKKTLKKKLSTGTGGEYPSFNGTRNFGQITAKAPYKNYGPPDHFRFVRMGDYENLPFYRAPDYGQPNSTRQVLDGSKVEDYGTLGPAAIGLLIGALVFMPLVGWPFIIKSFKPDLSYGRRVGIGLGISIGLAAVRTVAKAALGEKES